MRFLPLGIAPLLFLIPAAGWTQSPALSGQTSQAPAQPRLSPGAAYDEAMHPLEVTRHSISNWSETEMAALSVTMGQAAAGCAARDAKNFNGSDLIDLARLCSLGVNYPAVVQAATRYIDAEGTKPQLTQAYASLIDALLRMKDERDALSYAETMLDAVPYDALTAETMESAIGFMQFVYTPDALKLAVKREPLLLERLRAASAAAATAKMAAATTPGYPGAEPPQSIHELYIDGITLAVMQQLSRIPATEIAATVTALDSALPAALTPDESIPIATTRRRYAMLGRPLPDIGHPSHPADPKKADVLLTLDWPPIVPRLPALNAVTGLLLFPDWCVQCIRMAGKLPQTVFTVKGYEAYVYGLLVPTVAQTPPSAQPAAKATSSSNSSVAAPAASPMPFTPADASNLLRGTATLVGDPSLLEQFTATDVPVLILTDSQGIVRVLQPVSDQAGESGGTIDAAIALIGDTWPSPKLTPVVPQRAEP